jgi:hypothetical protein
MNYFNKSKLRILPQLENNYDKILDDFNNFDYRYKDILGRFKIDTLFKKWKGLYEFSLQADKKSVFLDSTVKSRKKNFGYYELEVDDKIIWDGIILATKANLFKKFNQTYVGRKYFSNTLSLFKSYKEVITVSIARFPSNRIIPVHKGNRELVRIHYGVKVPDGDIAFTVKGEEKKWENGKAFAFNDFYEHGGWNNTNSDRIILIVDLDRKMILNGV